jgi:hypothetical protein
MTMLTEHFTLEEFLYSDTAVACGIDNTPTDAIVQNLTRVAEVLEEVRRIVLDQPIFITSGYRCPDLNTACGGAANSAHLSGLAADFVCTDYGTPYDVCIAVEPYVVVLEIDQLIWEYGGWVHLGLADGQARHQCLTIDESGTREGFH